MQRISVPIALFGTYLAAVDELSILLLKPKVFPYFAGSTRKRRQLMFAKFLTGSHLPCFATCTIILLYTYIPNNIMCIKFIYRRYCQQSPICISMVSIVSPSTKPLLAFQLQSEAFANGTSEYKVRAVHKQILIILSSVKAQARTKPPWHFLDFVLPILLLRTLSLMNSKGYGLSFTTVLRGFLLTVLFCTLEITAQTIDRVYSMYAHTNCHLVHSVCCQ